MFETPIHWVKAIEPKRLGLMARSRGGEWLGKEVAAWRLASLSMVVSLLEPQEVRELELQEEPALCAAHGIGFRHFPIPDRGTPSSSRDVFALVAELHALLGQGEAVVIHCRADSGRTGVIAGCRGIAMPDTSLQVEWVEKYTHSFPRAR